MNTELKGQGFILRIIPSREADVIVRILTSEGEKISAFARSGLKSRKRFGGALEPLLHVEFFAVKRATSELFILEEVHVKNDFRKLKTDMDKIMQLAYLAELTEQSAQEGLENRELYNLFGAAIRALQATEVEAERVIRHFEVKLLALMGWLPQLDICGLCGKGSSGPTNEGFPAVVVLTLNAQKSMVTCQDCHTSDLEISIAQKNIAASFLRTSILKNNLNNSQARELAPITTSLLAEHFHGKKMRSLQFAQSLRRFEG